MSALGQSERLAHPGGPEAAAAAAGGWAVRWRMLAKDTFVYGLSGALSRVVGLTTFPILTRSLSPENYGRVDYLLSIASLGAMVLMMGQDSALARQFYEERPDEQRRRMVTQAFGIQLAATVVVLGIFSWVLFQAPARTASDRDFRLASLLQLANLPMIVITSFGSNLLRWTFRRRGFVAVTLGGAITAGVGMLLGLWGGAGSVAGVLLGLLAANTVVAVASLWAVRDWLVWPCGLEQAAALLRYGLPYMGIAVLGAGMATLERTLVLSIGTESTLGFYAAGARVASVMLLLVGAFQAAWAPMSLAIHRRPDAADTYSRVLLIATIALVSGSIAIHFLADPAVTLLAGSGYGLGAAVVGPLMLGHAARALGWVGGIGIDLSKKTYWVIPAQLCGTLVTINFAVHAENMDVVPRVAWAACAGQVASATFVSYFGNRCTPQGIRYALPGAVIAAGVAAIACF